MTFKLTLATLRMVLIAEPRLINLGLVRLTLTANFFAFLTTAFLDGVLSFLASLTWSFLAAALTLIFFLVFGFFAFLAATLILSFLDLGFLLFFDFLAATLILSFLLFGFLL